MQLPVTNVDSDDVTRTPLEQYVGEAASGGADIQPEPSRDGDLKHVERVRELDAAAAHPWVLGRCHPDLHFVRHLHTGFRRRVADHLDVAREDQRLGFFARLGEPARHEEHVETSLARAHDVRRTTQSAIAPSRELLKRAEARASCARVRHAWASARERSSPNNAG